MSEELAQQHLQDILVKTYFSNLEFLKSVDKDLYERIDNLSQVINSGIYEERYELEFITDDGEFDIYDSISDTYIYNKNPKKNINNAISSVNFDKKGFFSILEQDLFRGKKYDVNVDKYKLQENYDSHTMLYNDIQKYFEVLKDDTLGKKNLKEISKFIFIGTLLSRHISGIVNKIKSKYYFIHEPNLEIFRLSMFVFDYTLLLKNNAYVTFSVMDDATEFERKLFDFLSLDSWSNHTIKYHTTDYNIKQSFDNVLNAIMSFKPTTFNYFMLLYNIFRNTTKRVDTYKMISFPLEKDLNLFAKKPVLYICAGPSLGDNMEWLKVNSKNFYIVAIGASYRKLIDVNINVDVIITIDSKYNDLNKLQFDIESCKKIQDTIVFATCNTDERILKRFNQQRLFLIDALYSLRKESIPFEGFSVGEIGFRLLLELGVKELYLLGTDLAIHQEKGITHEEKSSGHKNIYDLDNIEDSVKKGAFSLRDDLIKVKGNLENKVFTNRNFNNSINCYNIISQNLKQKEQNIYNLSNHGAFIYNTIPSEAKIINVKNDIPMIDLLDKLEQVSIIGLLDIEKEIILKEKEFLEHILQEIEIFQSKTLQTYSEFKKEALFLNNRIMQYSQDENSFLGTILSNYFSIINVYIDYHFNNTKIKKEAKKIENIKKLWSDEVKTLIKDYFIFLSNVKT